MDSLDLCNAIRMEFGGILEDKIPLNAFPAKIQFFCNFINAILYLSGIAVFGIAGCIHPDSQLNNCKTNSAAAVVVCRPVLLFNLNTREVGRLVSNHAAYLDSRKFCFQLLCKAFKNLWLKIFH